MVYIVIKDVVAEVFQDYKKPGMLIATSKCDWKCLTEEGLDVGICQNSSLSKQKNRSVEIKSLVDYYLSNQVTSSVIFGGLEPILQLDQIVNFIRELRSRDCFDDVVIYTGYYLEEIDHKLEELKRLKNVIMKFGRFKPNSKPVFDEVLGITLASSNQYGMKIS